MTVGGQEKYFLVSIKISICRNRGRHGGLVVECPTPEQEVGGSILTQVAVLCH